MQYKPEIFREQFPLVKYFVCHLIYYRGLYHEYQKIELKSSFGRLQLMPILFGQSFCGAMCLVPRDATQRIGNVFLKAIQFAFRRAFENHFSSRLALLRRLGTHTGGRWLIFGTSMSRIVS